MITTLKRMKASMMPIRRPPGYASVRSKWRHHVIGLTGRDYGVRGANERFWVLLADQDTPNLEQVDSAPFVYRAGLGRRIKWLLTALGITEHRYRRAKSAVGLKPSCGCGNRERAADKLARW